MGKVIIWVIVIGVLAIFWPITWPLLLLIAAIVAVKLCWDFVYTLVKMISKVIFFVVSLPFLAILLICKRFRLK